MYGWRTLRLVTSQGRPAYATPMCARTGKPRHCTVATLAAHTCNRRTACAASPPHASGGANVSTSSCTHANGPSLRHTWQPCLEPHVLRGDDTVAAHAIVCVGGSCTRGASSRRQDPRAYRGRHHVLGIAAQCTHAVMCVWPQVGAAVCCRARARVCDIGVSCER